MYDKLHNSRRRIVRGRRPDSGWTAFANALLQNRTLSFKARGILAYLLSKPEDWCCLVGDLSTGLDGRTSVLSGLKELRAAGYISYVGIRTPDGKRIEDWEYVCFGNPTDNPFKDGQHVDPGQFNRMMASVPAERHGQQLRSLKVDDQPAGRQNAGDRRQQRNDVEKQPHLTQKQAVATRPRKGGVQTPPSDTAAAIFHELQKVTGVDQDWAFEVSSGPDLTLDYTRKMVERCHIEGHGPNWLRVAIQKNNYTPFKPKVCPRGEGEDRRRMAAKRPDELKAYEAKIALIEPYDWRRIGNQLADSWDNFRDWWHANPSKSNFTFGEKIVGRWEKEKRQGPAAGSLPSAD